MVLLLLVVAGVAGFFTRPQEPKMREAADAVLSDPQNISEGLESVGATIAGDRAFSDYYVVTKYAVSLNGDPVVNCWGAFTQVQCHREDQEGAATH
jgi:hypothetical protein